MTRPVRTGVVGFGRIAEEVHCRLLSSLPEFALAAVSDVTPARREAARQKYPAIPVYGTWEDLVADDSIELVVIATPPNSHKDLALGALRAGKHVLVEKPFALFPAEAEEMIEAGERAGRIISAFQNRRWDRDFQAVKRAVDEGRLGKLLSIESRMMFDFDPIWFETPGYRPWRLEAAYGGGILYDVGPHQYDQLLQLVAEPVTSVYCETRAWCWAKEVENHYKCFLTFADGALAQVEACQVAKIVPPKFYLIGEMATLEERDWIGPSPRILIHSGAPGEPQVEEVPLAQSGPADLYRGLHAALRYGAQAPVTAGEVLRTTRLIDAAYRSARAGQVLRVHI